MAIRLFITLWVAIGIILSALLLHIFVHNKKMDDAQLRFVNITKITEPAFETSTLESRFLHLTKESNRVYPTLLKPESLEFVYAK